MPANPRFLPALFGFVALLAFTAVAIAWLRHGRFELTAFMGGLFMLFFAILTGRGGRSGPA